MGSFNRMQFTAMMLHFITEIVTGMKRPRSNAMSDTSLQGRSSNNRGEESSYLDLGADLTSLCTLGLTDYIGLTPGRWKRMGEELDEEVARDEELAALRKRLSRNK